MAEKRKPKLSIVAVILLAGLAIVFLLKNPTYTGAAAALRGEYITGYCTLENADKVAADVVNEIILAYNCGITCNEIINTRALPGNTRVDIICDSYEALERFRESCEYYRRLSCG